jgi:hypothetical protein
LIEHGRLERIAAAKKLNDPEHGVYGIALRGGRGSGANVWRWMPCFRGFGGKWTDGDKFAFNSDAAVKATAICPISTGISCARKVARPRNTASSTATA